MHLSKTLILYAALVTMVVMSSTAAARSYARSYSSSSSSAVTAAVVAGALVASSGDSKANVAATCKMPEESHPDTLYKCLSLSKSRMRLVDGKLRYCPGKNGFRNYYPPGEQCRASSGGILGFIGFTRKADTLSLDHALDKLVGEDAQLYSVVDRGGRYHLAVSLPLSE